MSHIVKPLTLPGLQSPTKSGVSPSKSQSNPGQYRTPKRKERNTFPTTPRSVEKQKKMIGARLKRLMENHLRLTATNKMLKGMNTTLLDQACQAEVGCNNQQILVAKAQHERIFQQERINVRSQYVGKIENRDIAQEKNLRDLVRYAKKITSELEDYKQKVEMSERVVADLRNTGNESVDSLFAMLKRYKRQQRNTQEEIEKLNQLIIIKDNEITGLNEELHALNDVRQNMASNNQRKSEQAKKMLDENKAVIKRQDKLIVDLQQKNEVCQIAIAQTEEEVLKRYNERTALQVRLKDLEDGRKTLTANINTMNGKIFKYREYSNYQTQLEQERMKELKAEQKRQAEEAKALAGRRGYKGGQNDANSPLKSALSRKQARSGSLKSN